MPLYPGALRYTWDASDHGLLAATSPPHLCTGSTVMGTGGRIEFAKIRVPQPVSVTNIVMSLITAGATLTAGQCFAALYTGASALVGVTADQASAWGSGAPKNVTMALASGPFSLSAGNYYVAFWFNGTTGPTWARAGAIDASLVNIGTATPNLMFGSADTSITTTAPGTLGAQTVRSAAWWVGLS